MLCNMREKLNYKVASVTRLGFPFYVQSHIDRKFNIEYKDNLSRLVYVDLKAADE